MNIHPMRLATIVGEALARERLTRLQQDFFPHFAMIAYETEVRVLRREKF